jgi:phospholipid/cholesterol/gamma-HCH transport system ATP-binding protein
MTEIKIKAEGLAKNFAGKQVLRGIDMAVPADSKSVLIGPAASGKSVLMKCLAGLYPLNAGSIEIDGVPVPVTGTDEHVELMRTVGILFQQGGLFDSLPVWENVAFKLLHSFGTERAEAKKLAIEKLAMVNLAAATGDLLPSEISGGMQKRVGIARALAGDPKLLLLDEPTAGLDPITTAAINRLIDHCIHEIGATVLLITSDMTSARQEYDHLFMLHEGQIVWRGKTDEIDEHGNEFVEQLINGRGAGPIKMRIKARA